MIKIARILQVILIASVISILAVPPWSLASRLTAPLPAPGMAAPLPAPQSPEDTISDYLALVSETNLTGYVTDLVGFGPRLVNAFQVYTDDACSLDPTIHPTNNLDRAANHAKSILESWGYTVTLEAVPGYGHNVVTYKTGSAYPNVYIEFGAHLDTKPGTPGGNDNASGSAAVMEIARVLKDYPSRYSMTFALWVAEETGGFAGAYHHIDAMLAAGKVIKAGLNLDNMGQIGGPPSADPFFRNDVWTNSNPESVRLWNILNQVNTAYDLGLTLVNNANPCCSDGHAYWNRGLVSVTSVGGWTPSSPNYHGCGDTAANFSPPQAVRVTRQNLAAGLTLDQDVIPPQVSLSISPTSIPADGVTTAIATATVTDYNGNPLTGETVVFSTDGDVNIGPVSNLGDGDYQVTLTASTTPGEEMITASVQGVEASASLFETCAGNCFTDSTRADFAAGSLVSGVYLSEMNNGEVMLAPAVGAEFSGLTLPAGWETADWNGPKNVTQNGDTITLRNARLNTIAGSFGPGRAIEFEATMNGGQYQFGGLALDGQNAPYVGFHFPSGGTTMYVNASGTSSAIGAGFTGSAHRYRLEWNAATAPTQLVYSIDGVEVGRQNITEAGPMRPFFTDYASDSPFPLDNVIDWVHMTPYAATGTFLSRVFDGGSIVNWSVVDWSAHTPGGTGLAIEVRSGNSATPDAGWSSFTPIDNGGSIGAAARYVQYRVLLTTADMDRTPLLTDISLRYSTHTLGPPVQLGFVTQPAGAIAGSPFGTQPVVAVQDAAGFTVDTDQSTQVTLSIGANPAGGALACSANPVTVVNGLASFTGCEIDQAGTGYTLAASAAGLAPATSAALNVAWPGPASISLVLTPDTMIANGSATAIATATVLDALGSPLPGRVVSFSTNGDVTFGTVSDLGNGSYQVTITASTTSGDETITAADGALTAEAVLHESPALPTQCLTDTSLGDFQSGTPDASLHLAQVDSADAASGEVILKPAVVDEFNGPALGPNWTILFGSAAVSGGQMTVGTSSGTGRVREAGLYGAGRVVEFRATLNGGLYQFSGFALDGSQAPYVGFHFPSGGTTMYANTNGTTTNIGATYTGTPHRYRIEWNSAAAPTQIVYSIDGTERARHTVTEARSMRPMFSDSTADASVIQVDWVRMSPYATSGGFVSRVFDGGSGATWGSASWTADVPAGTSIEISVRSGSTPTPDAGWSAFIPVANGGSIGAAGARYVQYRAMLATTNPDQTPALKDVCLAFANPTPPAIISRSPAPGSVNATITTPVNVVFNKPMNTSTITTASFRLRSMSDETDVPATVTASGSAATLTPTSPLTLGEHYEVVLLGTVTDATGMALGSNFAWSFIVGGGILSDTTFGDFNAGTPEDVYAALNGEVILMPSVVDEFSTAGAAWTDASHGCGTSSLTFVDGWAVLRCRKLYLTATFGPGRSIEFSSQFSGGSYQFGGFALDGNNPPWAGFDFDITGTTLTANENNTHITPIPGAWTGAAHRYRVEWNTPDAPGQIVYRIDGVERARHTHTEPGLMRPMFTDYANLGAGHRIDWVRMSPYATSGLFTSRVLDAGQIVDWADLTHIASLPTGTALAFETRSSTDNVTWSTWQAVNSPIASPNGRYLQYRVAFNTGSDTITPVLEAVNITYYLPGPTAVDVFDFHARSRQGTVRLTWTTVQEIEILGFHIHRATSPDGETELITSHMIPAEYFGLSQGKTYQYFDATAPTGTPVYYWLEVVRASGKSDVIGPLPLSEDHDLFLPLIY